MHSAPITNRQKISAQGVLLWTARGLAAASLAFMGLFIVSHLVEGGPSPTPNEWLGIACFPGGVFLGLLAGMRYPVIGGVVSLLSLAAFYAWNFSQSGQLPSGPFFLLLTFPGLLFLLVGLAKNRG